MATFGKTAIGGTFSARGVGLCTTTVAVLSEAGTVTGMSWYGAKHTGTPNMQVVIYDDDGGVPGNLLAQSTTTSINSSTPQWWDFTISVALTAGTYYLGWIVDNTVNYYHGSVAGSQPYQTGLTFPTVGDPFSLSGTQDRDNSIYATYTPSAPSGWAGKIQGISPGKVQSIAVADIGKIQGV